MAETVTADAGMNKVVVTPAAPDKAKQQSFRCEYDKVFAPDATQSDVYDALEARVLSVVQGINATVFAYGQTGTGKTHTMLGRHVERDLATMTMDRVPIGRWGVIPRVVLNLFKRLESEYGSTADTSVRCSYLQLYNEKVLDLLSDEHDQKPLPVREHGQGANKVVFAAGLSEYRVACVSDVMALLQKGARQRKVRETEYNEVSSRSHALLQVCEAVSLSCWRWVCDTVCGGAVRRWCCFVNVVGLRVAQLTVSMEIRKPGERRTVRRKAKLNLVDLAGSEKWDTSGAVTIGADRQRELTSINKSLSALGNCISALTEDKRIHIPYRDSLLTRLLQDSLGGNTMTTIIATLSLASNAIDETISTLKFADRARRIMTRVRVNEMVDDAVLLERARVSGDGGDGGAAAAAVCVSK